MVVEAHDDLVSLLCRLPPVHVEQDAARRLQALGQIRSAEACAEQSVVNVHGGDAPLRLDHLSVEAAGVVSEPLAPVRQGINQQSDDLRFICG